MPAAMNPVLRGGRPDPSACRVGDDVLLVTSSFAYTPGLPVHRSRDLVNWTLVGHVLADGPYDFLDGVDVSDGVWAPTIRWIGGLLHVVFSTSRGRGGHRTFVCTAREAAGPWSEPVELEAPGFDPSLFEDRDGRVWFTACRNATVPGQRGEIWMREYDPAARTLRGPEHVLWHGAMAGAWIEAPHLYRRDGGPYLLLGAEGGTERMHAVTAATADAVTGPYTTDPRSPLLTHRHLGDDARLQNVGHADLVDGPDGRSWAVALGVRPVDRCHTTGREVLLVPVRWEHGLPVFAPGHGVVPDALDGPTVRPQPPEWVGLRGATPARVEDGAVVLTPAPDPLHGRGRPAFLGARQTEAAVRLEAIIGPVPAGVVAGLVALQGQDRYVAIVVDGDDEEPRATVSIWTEGVAERIGEAALASGRKLWIDSDGRRVRWGTGDLAVGETAADLLSTESAGGFVGTLVGMLAEGVGDPVRFDDVDLVPRDAAAGVAP
jgi:xylan 1,4-beta-xylosidase